MEQVKTWIRSRGRRLAAGWQNQRAGRYAVRFFAAMLVLTLVARGVSGAAMPVVTLTTPTQGAIVQQAETTATVTAGEGESLALPAGITVQALYAAAGQSLTGGEAILQLDKEELQDALDEAKAALAQQQAQLDQLNAATAPDGSSVAAAQQSLDRANEDYTRTDIRTRAAVDEANATCTAAQSALDEAEKALQELQAQTDPPPTEEQLAAARQAVDEAQATLAAARQAVQDAETSREDSLLSARRSVENAESALAQANTAYSQAQASAALTAQSNAAQAQTLQLEMADTREQIALLRSLLDEDGLVTAPRDTQLLRCDLTEGQPCPEGDVLRLAKADSELLARFTLPAAQAEQLTAGQTVTLTQGSRQTEATVRTVSAADETAGTASVTAVLPETAAGFTAGTAQARLVFSRTAYSTVLPVSAIRQDTQGSYVLTVEESSTAFGIAYTARRVPVTVLEVDSSSQYAAVEGTISSGAITDSTRPVSPGTSVRVEE